MVLEQLEQLADKFSELALRIPGAGAEWHSKRWFSDDPTHPEWYVASRKDNGETDDLKSLCCLAARTKGYRGSDPLSHWLNFLKDRRVDYYETKNGSAHAAKGGDTKWQTADIGTIAHLAKTSERACRALLSEINPAFENERKAKRRLTKKNDAKRIDPFKVAIRDIKQRLPGASQITICRELDIRARSHPELRIENRWPRIDRELLPASCSWEKAFRNKKVAAKMKPFITRS